MNKNIETFVSGYKMLCEESQAEVRGSFLALREDEGVGGECVLVALPDNPHSILREFFKQLSPWLFHLFPRRRLTTVLWVAALQSKWFYFDVERGWLMWRVPKWSEVWRLYVVDEYEPEDVNEGYASILSQKLLNEKEAKKIVLFVTYEILRRYYDHQF